MSTPINKSDETPQPGAGKRGATGETGEKKRVVLKTLKRTPAVAPASPTLRKVTGSVVRRVLPKAPPKPPAPPPPPPPPPPPVAAAPAAPPPAPAVKPEPKPAQTPAPSATASAAAPAKPAAPASAKAVAPSPAAPAPASAKPVSAAPKAAPAAPKPAAAPDMRKASESGIGPATVKKEAPKVEPTATYKMPPPPPVKAPKPLTPRPAPAAPAAAPAAETAKAAAPAATETQARPKIRVPEIVTVKDLAERLNVKPIDVIKKLLGLGTMVTINQQIDRDLAVLAADSFGFDVEIVSMLTEEKTVEEKEDPAVLKPRAPIVTIMGHVDHGKTSLLDAIRSSRVAEKEAGGITQHIGAYRVKTSKGDVVFLDTPGHEAFTAMRARGAQVTDIVVLVVAADDGVMPQTVEAIDHAKAAGVTIMVAVNKIDLPTANVERIKRELSQHQLLAEDWGGKTIFVEVSAKKHLNIEKLLEMISLEAELLELRANPARAASGVIVEARLDSRRGVVATLLVQKGTLRMGDVVVAGTAYGRVRALLNDRSERLDEAGPSTPVEILGLSSVPQSGDRFSVLPDEREARSLVERRQLILQQEAVRRRHVTLETLHERVAEGKVRELKIILKADVQGSVQALRDALERMSTPEIRMSVIHAGVGAIIGTDVQLAAASDAIIIGFNVRPESQAEEAAKREDVDMRTYRIIYEAIADVRAAMEGLLEPEKTEIKLGRAEARQVFKVSKGGTIAGSFVLEGKITRGAKARLLRDNVVVHEGSIESLRRFKDDVREVEKGFECGIGLGNFQDIKPRDIIEAYAEESRARKLETPA